MASEKTTLYFALSNTQMEHLVEHVERNLKFWPYLLWHIPSLNLRWESDYRGVAEFTTGYAPDDSVAIYIYRHSPSSSKCFWFVANSNVEDLITKTFTLDVARYQQNRVEIALIEFNGSAMKDMMLEWIEQHWKDKYEILRPEAAPQPPQVALDAIYATLPTLETIDEHMASLGLAKDDDEWWDAYLDWVMAYRARHGAKHLPYEVAADTANVGKATFERRLEAWEKRTSRERDTRRNKR